MSHESKGYKIENKHDKQKETQLKMMIYRSITLWKFRLFETSANSVNRSVFSNVGYSFNVRLTVSYPFSSEQILVRYLVVQNCCCFCGKKKLTWGNSIFPPETCVIFVFKTSLLIQKQVGETFYITQRFFHIFCSITNLIKTNLISNKILMMYTIHWKKFI